MPDTKLRGVIAAIATPVNEDGSPDTARATKLARYLVDNGCEYVADWCNDDQPYQMTLDDGRTIVAMPYTQQLNDKSAIERRLVSAEGFQKMICDQFDVLYADSRKQPRVMGVPLHPMISGQPLRIKYLERVLAEMKKHERVWFATGGEIIDAYQRANPTG